MKIYQNILKIFVLIAVLSAPFSIGQLARASLVPNLSLSSISGTDQVQITIYGADPNVSVLLNYPSTASIASTNIGTTNSSGYLTTTISSGTYGIASNSSVYVNVDGQVSLSSVWPSYTSTAASSLSLSQNSITLTSGQSTVISAGVSGSLSVTGNTNPSIANASISGNQITVNSFNTGTTNITICSTGIGCSNLSVTVQSSLSSSAPTISLSQSNVIVPVGQSQTVSITGSGNYYVTGNSNSSIASVQISGATITVNGIGAGTDTFSVCASNGSSGTTCSNVNVTVTPSTTSTVTSTTNTLSFSQSNVNLSIGQTQSVSIYGGSVPYYVSTNSAPTSVGANVANNTVNISGIAFGGSNVTICAVGNQCGTFYVYVAPTNTTSASNSTTASVIQSPVLTSFSVASNGANSTFTGSGDILSFNFSANQTVNIPQVTVNGSSVSVNGTGSGPYTATYTMTGNESLPLSVIVHISNAAGSASDSYFGVGSTGTKADSTASISSASQAPSTSLVFTDYLYVGSTGSQVAALQRRLKADGFFSAMVTGTFGPVTQAAVKAYQAAHSLSQLGVVGPATRTLLNSGI